MKICRTKKSLSALSDAWHRAGETVALVPTMGFLHEGHLSLVRIAKRRARRVVVSVFVNPTQFGPNEDFETYPRDMEKDAALCEAAGANLIFNPEPEEMYTDALTTVSVDKITKVLCGKTRPIHFNGVCTVVSKLFNIVTPDRAYFGQKDAQQLLVIRKMVKDLNFDIEIVGCPIIREADGLAKSSRNTYLSPEERKAALCLSRGLNTGRALAEGGADADEIKTAIRSEIEKEPMAKVDYVEVVDLDSLEPAQDAKNILAAVAVYIGKTRLIDNFIME